MALHRRHIFAPIFFWLVISGLISYGLSFGLEQSQLIEGKWTLPASLVCFFVLSLLTFFLKIHRPIQIIIREMKALLTGKVYRKIMTSKQDEIGIMAHFFNEVTRNLETISSDFRSHSRIKKELNVAQQIQMDLLPEKPPEIPGLEITAKTRPASEIGGDTFDFFVDDKKALMYIGDSTGHGVPAGIVMVMVDTLIETFIDMKDDIVDIIISLNKYLKPHLQTTMFMTMILLEWIPETKTINWVGAGHEYLIHVKTSENKISAIAAGGIAVGMLADNTALVKKQTFQLVENDFIVLYSDGINEAKNVNGEIYTLERLLNLIKSHVSPEVSSNDVFEAIANDVSRFMAGHPQEDDMTLMVIKQSEAKLPAPASAVSS